MCRYRHIGKERSAVTAVTAATAAGRMNQTTAVSAHIKQNLDPPLNPHEDAEANRGPPYTSPPILHSSSYYTHTHTLARVYIYSIKNISKFTSKWSIFIYTRMKIEKNVHTDTVESVRKRYLTVKLPRRKLSFDEIPI